MSKNKKPFKELKKKTKEKIDQQAEKLLKSDPGKDIKSNLDWIENSTKLLSYRKNHGWFGRIPAAVVLFFFVLTAAGLLWTISLSRINMSMETVSSNAAFTLSESWWLPQRFTTGYLRIENFQALHGPELDLTFEDESGSAQLEVSGKKIVIERLELESGGIIEFETDSNLLTISVKQSKVKGAFALQNISYLSTTGIKHAEIKEKNFQYPETIEFNGTGESRVPINITVKIKRRENKNQWQFEGMKTQRIHFLKEVVSRGGEHSFISTIKQGEVKLYDIPGEVKIYKRDVVKMDHINLNRLEISCNGDLRTFVEGEVKNLKIGPRGFEKDLAPSLLIYLS